MDLYAATPRPGFVEAIRDKLSLLVGRPDFGHLRLSRIDPLDVHLVAPHDVFTVRIPDIRDGGLVAHALWVGQRYLVFDGDDPISSIELADPDGTGFMINEGRYVAATARSIRVAERAEFLPDAQIRVLRLPPLHVMALWLRADGGSVDLFLPMSPAPLPLEPQHPYSEDEMTRALQAIIARQREQPIHPEG